MDTCPHCGTEYKRVAIHWNKSSCRWPSFTDHEREVITGLLMGDANIDFGKKNPRLECEMTTQNYLKYIDDIFGVLSNGVKLRRTAEQNAKHVEDTGFRPDSKVIDYSDTYRLRTLYHPELQDFADWYSTGKKVWPCDIELTPTVLKHWYCGDGHYRNNNSHNHIVIAMANEIDNTNKIDKIFENVGLPSPSNYSISERKRDGSKNCNAVFTKSQSEKLWNYMGEAPPDFRYKWPNKK